MGLIVMPIIAAYLAGGALVAWLMQRWRKNMRVFWPFAVMLPRFSNWLGRKKSSATLLTHG